MLPTLKTNIVANNLLSQANKISTVATLSLGLQLCFYAEYAIKLSAVIFQIRFSILVITKIGMLYCTYLTLAGSSTKQKK